MKKLGKVLIVLIVFGLLFGITAFATSYTTTLSVRVSLYGQGREFEGNSITHKANLGCVTDDGCSLVGNYSDINVKLELWRQGFLGTWTQISVYTPIPLGYSERTSTNVFNSSKNNFAYRSYPAGNRQTGSNANQHAEVFGDITMTSFYG